jgi:hypothetical protein
MEAMNCTAPLGGFHHVSFDSALYHIGSTRIGELNSHHPQSPTRVEGVLTTVICQHDTLCDIMASTLWILLTI